MKITKRQLRKIIKEAVISESTEWPGDDEWIAVFAPLIQNEQWADAAALMVDHGFSYADIQMDLDDSEWKWQMDNQMDDAGTPLPNGWREKVENAAWKVEDKRMEAAIAGDPDVDWLNFLGNHWTSRIEPDDMKDIKWKQYKKYIRLKPPRSISHGVGEIHITKEDDFEYSNTPGTYEEFIEFLEKRAGGQLGRRKPYRRSPPPLYD